ncbi:MAG TPA: RNA 2',3'-cyclic phosphodiesterase [Terriglobales bacterium]|jgi:2'-5' RNA ligase
MRTFIALDIEDDIRERIIRFMEGVREFAPEARWVRPESLHITLKFIGEKPPDLVDRIKGSLAFIESSAVGFHLRGHGFFPTPRAARVFWIGIEAGPELEKLAGRVDEAMASLGVPRETHAFSPHLTLARAGGGSGSPARQRGDRPNRCFDYLRKRLEKLPNPDFGTMAAHEFFLYESRLGAGGARYTKIAGFMLH